jgi:hypothetical protein
MPGAMTRTFPLTNLMAATANEIKYVISFLKNICVVMMEYVQNLTL